jgi:EAL domain-containing protein (putative c-di-GMP-specific phosphodiesterase class I)
LDKLKLDQSFVSELSHNNDDLAISRAIISMAHSLRLRVIAEGVETEAQREILCDNDCDEMQGYLFSRPIPHAECEVLLRAQMKTFIHVGEC